MDLDCEWENFLNGNLEIDTDKKLINDSFKNTESVNTINCSDIYISTTTKILYLNKKIIDIYEHFWLIPIIDYDEQKIGIVKKQIKISLIDKESIDKLNCKLNNIKYAKSFVISNVEYENRIKHIKKVSIGLSKRDIISKSNKEKSAFYNCYVLTLRIFICNNFKETHIKIFNTGKIEIPGVQSNEMLEIVIKILKDILQTNIDKTLYIVENNIRNILINSNFNCGFYINRECLYNILRTKYNVNAVYDPCSYPGIRCIYYINDNKNNKISYMIFRTGSILIVGKCEKKELMIVYEYIKNILLTEYNNIHTKTIIENNKKINNIKKPSNIKKKIIYKELI